ncbi:MAG: MarR family transcriptional regulator [Actinomycetota bacterium]|nr:MarR family transcriptional regulator [Actinomycetota bacterium]
MTSDRKQGEERLAAELRLAVMRLARRLRQQAPADVTPSMLSALTVVERLGPITLGDLAGFERVRPPTMTRIVTRLEEDGLVEREPDESDGRVTRLELSSAGRKLIAKNRTRKDAYLADRLKRLSPRERARLEAGIEVIQRLLDEEAR